MRTTVGWKLAMAASGALVIAFLIAHMIGNLKFFYGRAAYDHYAAWLRDLGAPVLPHEGFLWLQCTGLLAAIAVHITAATVLTIRARRARPVGYVHRRKVQGSYAARTMRWGGVILLVNLGQLVITTIVMAVYSWQLTLVVFAAFLPAVLLIRILQRRLAGAYGLVRQRMGAMLAAIGESVVGAPVRPPCGTPIRPSSSSRVWG